ncbi:hypothetical protein, partial [Desulfovibrio psychrotolerans]|uniref:hypothetical protein n=1 Tax=Desulfovibrio psychrotolerans TaxID=415242 RepID=UPI001962997E
PVQGKNLPAEARGSFYPASWHPSSSFRKLSFRCPFRRASPINDRLPTILRGCKTRRVNEQSLPKQGSGFYANPTHPSTGFLRDSLRDEHIGGFFFYTTQQHADLFRLTTPQPQRSLRTTLPPGSGMIYRPTTR